PAQTQTPPGQNPPTVQPTPSGAPQNPPSTAPGAPAQVPPATTPAATPATQPESTGGGRANRPAEPPTHVELRNLATGAVKSWQDMQSFMFSANSNYLILRRKPATPAGGRGEDGAGSGGGAAGGRGSADAGPTPPRGADVILHNLTTGRDQLLG